MMMSDLATGAKQLSNGVHRRR